VTIHTDPVKALDVAQRALESPELREVVTRIRRGELTGAPVPGKLDPLEPGDLLPLPAPGTPLHAECMRLGEEALRRGEVAAVVVAGGAGTRLGGAVKALVPVVGDHTFLDVKMAGLGALARRGGRPIPLALMTSDLTHQPIAEHLARRGSPPDVLLFQQRMLPRLTPAGELFTGPDGQPSFAPAGHGDFFRAFRESGTAEALRARGVRHLFFSNIDNLAATVDPLIAGLHVHMGREMTVEVTARARPSGKLEEGAAPVRIGGRPQLVEKVDPARHPLLSTNNITFALGPLLERPIHLPYRVARKEVAGTTVLQLEQVTGEVSGLVGQDGQAVLSVAFIEVPGGDLRTTRFEPVKVPADMERAVQWVRTHLPELVP
jgi:UTP--glucose-1-phosphate uridylyltransferase